VGHHGGVLGGAQPQPDRQLGAVGQDRQRDHTAVLGDADPVDHQHRDLEVGQVAAQQFLQRPGGLGHEPAADRGLGGRAGRRLDGGADRLAGRTVAAGGQPGQHPLHDDLAEQVVGGEGGVGVEGELVAVNGARPWPVDRHPPPAQHHRAWGAAVPAGSPPGLLGVLGADLGGQLGLHQLGHHPQPDGHAHGQQPLLGAAGDVGHGQAQLVGQLGQVRGILAVGEADR
jgi:hypothetical protein